MTSQNVYTPGDPAVENIDPSTPLGRLLSISTRLMPGLWYCPAIPPMLCAELAQDSKQHNRKVSKNHVSLMAQVMRMGAWRTLVGRDIHFHKDGWLANGQHRLLAAKRANVPFQACIHTGLDNQDAAAIDQQRKRSPSDVMRISFGRDDYVSIRTSVARAMMLYEKPDLSFSEATDNWEACERGCKIPDDELALLKKIYAASRQLGLLTSVTGALVLEAYRTPHKDKVAAFVDSMEKGLSLEATDPAFLFRQYMLSKKDERTRQGSRWKRGDYAQIVIMALNLVTSGRKITRLQTPTKGSPRIDLACHPVIGASAKPLLAMA